MRAPWSRRALSLPLLLLLTVTTSASPNETRLLSDLFSGYDRRVRPVANYSEPLMVKFGLTLQEIDLNMERNEATLTLWVNMEWKDYRFPWDPEEYGNIVDTRVPPGELWLPDIMPYNMRPRPESSWLAQTLVVVKSDGKMLYVAPASLRVGCARDFVYGAHQETFLCTAKFGSWTYNGFQVDLKSEESADLSTYVPGDVFWTLNSAMMKRNVLVYPCCPTPYVDITLEVNITRSATHTALPNLPIAVSVLTSLASFLVPVDSPQKLTLPCLSLMAAGSAVLSEFGLTGNAEYRAPYMLVYHVYTYVALSVLLWSVLMVVLGRPRALRLPSCLRRLLTSCVASVCCLASPPDGDSKQLCYEWTALAELLDRLAFAVYLVVVLAGSANSSST